MELIILGIIVSLVITALIGIFYVRKGKNDSESFYVGGRTWGMLLVGVALLAQSIDGNATLGNSSLSFDFGFWAGAALPIGLALSLFLIGKLFAGKLNQMKLLTLADFFQIKYNRKIAIIASLLMLLSFGILMAGNIAAVGILVQPFFNINYQSAVIIICLVVLAYTLRGGIISDLYTDIFQMILLVIGMALTVWFLISHYNFSGFFASGLLKEKMDFAQMTTVGGGALVNWATIVALGFGNILAIDFAARIFAAKSPDAARKGCYVGGWLTLLLGLPFSFLPFFISWAGVKPVEGTPLLMTFATDVMPSYISMFLISGIIAAAISTIDGAMLSMGNILTHNLLNVKKDLASTEPKEAEKVFLYFSRLSLLPIACVAMIFAILLPSPGVLLTVAFDIMFASLLVPFVFGFVSKKPNVKAALYAIIFGGASRFIFATLTPTSFGVDNTFFYIPNSLIPADWDGLGTIIAPIISLIAYLIVAKMERSDKKPVTVNS